MTSMKPWTSTSPSGACNGKAKGASRRTAVAAASRAHSGAAAKRGDEPGEVGAVVVGDADAELVGHGKHGLRRRQPGPGEIEVLQQQVGQRPALRPGSPSASAGGSSGGGSARGSRSERSR